MAFNSFNQAKAAIDSIVLPLQSERPAFIESGLSGLSLL